MRCFTTHLHVTRVALAVAVFTPILVATSTAGERRYSTVPHAFNGKTGVMVIHEPEKTNCRTADGERRYSTVPFAFNGKTGVMTTFVPRRATPASESDASSGRTTDRARR